MPNRHWSGSHRRSCTGGGFIQRRADNRGKSIRGDRFLEEMNVFCQYPAVDNGIFGIARHVDHLEPWHDLPEPIRQFRAGHLRHDDIGEQKTNHPLMPGGQCQRFLAVTGGKHDIAKLTEYGDA